MSILLPQPAMAASARGGDDVCLFEPLALEYLAAGIPAEHDIYASFMVRPEFTRDDFKAFLRCVRRRAADSGVGFETPTWTSSP